jgi:hemerythrin-like domain-containing protein
MTILAKIREVVSSELNPDGIFEILKREHREVSALMELVEASEPGASARADTFARIASSLLAHIAAENEVLYPALDVVESTHGMALEALQEHHVIDLLVAELRGTAERGEEWLAKFHVLTENVEHHVKEEEEKFFPSARRVLGAEEQVEMADAYVAARDRHLGTPLAQPGPGPTDLDPPSGPGGGDVRPLDR